MDSKVDLIFLLYTQNTSILCQLVKNMSSSDSFVANSLEPDQARRHVGPDLHPKCLTRGWCTNVFKILIHVVKKDFKFHYAKNVNSFACKRQVFNLLIRVASQTVWTWIRPDKQRG